MLAMSLHLEYMYQLAVHKISRNKDLQMILHTIGLEKKDS
jgi:hypothetical protein